MAERDKASDAAVAVSIGAAIAAAYALLQKRVNAAPGQVVALDDATMNLLLAIAQASGNIDSNTLSALDKLQEIIDKLSAGGAQGWPPNTDSIQTIRVICAAANRAYRLPDMVIPDGFAVVIAAWPLNANLIYIGGDQSAATNPNSVDAIAAGGLRTFAVQNAKCIWISALAAGDSVTLAAEKRSLS